MNKLGMLLENLYQYHFRNWKGRGVVYTLTFVIALLYALINALILGRPEPSVVLESAVLTVILLVGLPIAYIVVTINPQSSASELLKKNLRSQKDDREKVQRQEVGRAIINEDRMPITDTKTVRLPDHENQKTA